MGTEDVKVTAMNMYKYMKGYVYTNVGRVALISISGANAVGPSVGHLYPSVGLTLT